MNIFSEKWAFGNNIEEMCTAAKPWYVKQLFESGELSQVLFFDPDMVLFSPVDELESLFESESILLTPHLCKPEENLEAVLDNELCSLKHGVFNLGFFGIKNDDQGAAFVNWWAERLLFFCHADLSKGVWTDQKWINFAPVFFDRVKILKSGKYNLAPWNVGQREIKGTLDEGISVEGEPLAFFHFTGFDSGMHEVMLKKYLKGRDFLLELPKWYREKLKEHSASFPEWSLNFFHSGEKISEDSRKNYLESNFDPKLREDSPYSRSNDYFRRS